MPVPTNEPEIQNTAAATSNDVSPPESENGRDSDGTTSPCLPMNGLEPSAKPNKMFIGGLSWQTDEEKLQDFFESFGEVTECNIMKDPVTKKSRGFGFITFKDPENVQKVLESHAEESICINDKTIDPKVAVPPRRLSSRGLWENGYQGAPHRVKRIFVGGLSSDSTEDDIRKYFEQFGKVLESQLMYDRNTNRHRGFGFVTFECEEPAEKVCSIQYHDIKGKKVEVKVAQTKEALAMQGRGRIMTARGYASYGYPAATQAYAPYYGTPYPLDLLVGSGYSAPVMMGPGGGRPRNKGRGYSSYPAPAFTFAPGYVDHRQMNGMGGYYQPSYGGILPPQMIRGPMDHGIPTSGMEYLPDHFQGMTISAGYAGAYGNAPPSPVGQYTPMSPGIGTMDPSSGGYASNGAPYTSSSVQQYSPTHTLSPKGTTTTTINGFNTQVPTYTGSQNSYAVAQASY